MGIIGTTVRRFESRGLAAFVDAQVHPFSLKKAAT